MFIVRSGVPLEKGPIRFANCATEWERARVRGSAAIHSVAHVPDNHPDAGRIRRTAPTFPRTTVVEDDQVERLDEAPAAPTVVQELSLVVQVHAIATAHGWDAQDLAGTGLHGEPGDVGGRSATTGLSLAEMALTRPPVGWHEIRAAGRPPWEAADWAAPAPEWRPLRWRDHAPPPEPEPAKPPVEAEADPELEAAPTPVPDPSGASAEADSEEGEPEGVNPLDAYPGASFEDDDGNQVPLTPDEQDAYRRAAVTITLKLLAQRKGDVPHPNAVNHQLKKNVPPLPPLNSAQIKFICSHSEG